MPKKCIGVLMGGPSAEREISLVTGKAICDNLNKEKYEVLPIEMSKQGQLFLDGQYYFQLNGSSSNKTRSYTKELIKLDHVLNKVNSQIDKIFIAMHGTYGEDGCVQGMLETLGIKYTGSGVLASALAMNKAKTAEIYRQNGLLVPDHIDFKKQNWEQNRGELVEEIKKQLGFPVVIKPVDQGSSVGTFLVKQEQKLEDTIISSFLTSDWIMAQQYIEGQEGTCGILERDGKPFATPTTHIIANKGDFYDLASKYDDGGSTHICPADFSKEINKRIQEIALKAHKILDCKGMSRTDVFVAKDERIYVIETNTIPGMTPTSLLPESASQMGIGFSDMLDLIIDS
ncbi:MAG: D-alanine--D-alanine ligase [bacterium]